MARLMIWFKYDCTAVDAYDIYGVKYLNNARRNTDPGCTDGIQFHKDVSKVSVSMASKWYFIPISTDPTRTFRIAFNANGVPKELFFWSDDLGTWTSRTDDDPPDADEPGAPAGPLYRMCDHSMTATATNKDATTNMELSVAVRCKWILIGGFWYCMPY